MYLRVAEPIEMWDGTGEDAARDLAEQPDWSVFEVGELSPATILASFYGNRTGHGPMRFAYVSFTQTELLSTGGWLAAIPAFFDWPPEVSAAHRDLLGHQECASNLFANYDPASRLHTIQREEVVAELAVLTSRFDTPGAFRKNALKRLRRVRDDAPETWQRVRDFCGGRVDPDSLFG